MTESSRRGTEIRPGGKPANGQQRGDRLKKISEDRKTVSPPINSLRPNPFLPVDSQPAAKPVSSTPDSPSANPAPAEPQGQAQSE